MEKFLLIASDVHADSEVFEKLAVLAQNPDCLAFLFCGDLGADDYFISDILQRRNFVFLSVLGNCDSATDYIAAGLPSVPLFRTCEFCNKRIFMTHGHYFTQPADAGLVNEDFDFVFTGHTHINGIIKTEKTVYLNPGSASRPRGGQKASYAVVIFKKDGSTEEEIRFI